MLRYLAIATAVVVFGIALGARFAHPGRPLDVAAVQATGSPSPPRAQGLSTRTPEPVTGRAPWALSALPECFTPEGEARGSLVFVRTKLERSFREIPPGWVLTSENCTALVGRDELAVVRGEERMVVPGIGALYADTAHPWGSAARRRIALIAREGRHWTLRAYRTPSSATIAANAR